MGRVRPWTSVVLAVAAGPLLLAGCGTTDISPGVGISVDGRTTSAAEVDDLVDGFCGFLSTPAPGQQPTQALPKGDARRELVSTLVTAEVARVLADREGIELGRDAVRQPDLSGVPERFRDAVAAYAAASEYAQAVVAEVGRRALQAQGAGGAGSTPQELVQAGLPALEEVAGDVEVELDPTYGAVYRAPTAAELQAGASPQYAARRAETGASVAASASARIAADGPRSAEEAQAYVASLPDDQVCGVRVAPLS